MRRLKVTMHDRERSREESAITKGLNDFNIATVGMEDWRDLTIAYKDADGRVVAGLSGHSDWGWLFVKLLWVSGEFRKKGLGNSLMSRAEAEARRRGCRGIWLDTFSFQAPKFYERRGYRIFGELDDYPEGGKRHFYMKRLGRRRRQPDQRAFSRTTR